jgi:hypothetical protein
LKKNEEILKEMSKKEEKLRDLELVNDEYSKLEERFRNYEKE